MQHLYTRGRMTSIVDRIRQPHFEEQHQAWHGFMDPQDGIVETMFLHSRCYSIIIPYMEGGSTSHPYL